MKNLKAIVLILSMPLSLLLMGCSNNSESTRTRSIFDTREEAEEAAKHFKCTGAHQMGNKWMPCESHDSHEDLEKNDKHRGHHHNH